MLQLLKVLAQISSPPPLQLRGSKTSSSCPGPAMGTRGLICRERLLKFAGKEWGSQGFCV